MRTMTISYSRRREAENATNKASMDKFSKTGWGGTEPKPSPLTNPALNPMASGYPMMGKHMQGGPSAQALRANWTTRRESRTGTRSCTSASTGSKGVGCQGRMMSNRVLQAASGRHERLLRLTEARHRAWVAPAEYRACYGRLQRRWPPTWDEVAAILDSLAGLPDGAILTWLDADVVLLEPLDPSSLLPAGSDAAMVRNTWGLFNVGVMVLRVGPQLRNAFRQAGELGPLDGYQSFEDQPRLNQCFRRLRVAELDSRFNYYQAVLHPPGGSVVIRGFHDVRDVEMKFQRMQGVMDATAPVRPALDA